MHIVNHKKIYFAVTAIITIVALAAVAIYGLKPSLEFTGGTLVEVRYEGTRPSHEALSHNLEAAGFEGFSLRETGEQGFTLRAHNLSTEQRENLPTYFASEGATAQIAQLTEVGPTLGTELRNKSLVALGLVLLCILLFIAFAFRKVSEPVSSWVYGFVAIVTLVHDVIVPTGFFALLGHFTGAEVDTLFVTAILTVLGFSIHDTIVVFDRTRENLRLNQEQHRKEPFAETAGRSLNQTLVRSINTSLTVIITLVVLYVFGPESTKAFSLTLLVGILAGTFSSIALATPLLVQIEAWQARKGR